MDPRAGAGGAWRWTLSQQLAASSHRSISLVADRFELLFLISVELSVEKGITLNKGEGRSRASDHREDITKWSFRMSGCFAFWQPKLRKEKEPFPLLQDRLPAVKPSLLSPMSSFFPSPSPFTPFCVVLASQTGQL